jgi:hypothetical protein
MKSGESHACRVRVNALSRADGATFALWIKYVSRDYSGPSNEKKAQASSTGKRLHAGRDHSGEQQDSHSARK